MDVAGESEAGKIIDQPLPEPAGAGKPVDFLGREAQVLEKIERLLEPGRDQETASRRQPADEELEHRRSGLAMIQVGLNHVELIEIGEQRVRRPIHVGHLANAIKAEFAAGRQPRNARFANGVKTPNSDRRQAACLVSRVISRMTRSR